MDYDLLIAIPLNCIVEKAGTINTERTTENEKSVFTVLFDYQANG